MDLETVSQRTRERGLAPSAAAYAAAMSGEVGTYRMNDTEHALACCAAESTLMKAQQPRQPTPYLMSLQPSQVHVNAALSNVAVMWENREYIADRVMPVIPVPKRSDVYFVWNPETMFQIADVSIVSNKGRPGEITYGLGTTTYTVADFGLMDFVSYDEIANADAPLAPQQSSVEIVTNYLLLAREQRVANATFATGNYPGGQTSALTGSAQWDQPTSDPVNDIETAIELCLVRPNHLVIGVQAWIKLRQHPKLTQFIVARAATTDGATPLRVTAEVVAAAFELEGVIIGRAKYLSSVEGVTKTYGYLWGKSASLIRIEQQPDRRKTENFAYTFRFSGDGKGKVDGLGGPGNGGWEVRQITDQIPGRAGGIWNKVAHGDIEQITGKDSGGTINGVGYLYTTVVA